MSFKESIIGLCQEEAKKGRFHAGDYVYTRFAIDYFIRSGAYLNEKNRDYIANYLFGECMQWLAKLGHDEAVKQSNLQSGTDLKKSLICILDSNDISRQST